MTFHLTTIDRCRRSRGFPGRSLRAGRPVPRRRTTGRKAARPSDTGTSTVELVITMPALLLAVLTVLQFGLWMHAQHVAQAAAREGATIARADGGSQTAARDATTASLRHLGPTILRDPTVEVSRTSTEATVTVTGRATSIVGIFGLPVREQARGPVERFVPQVREFGVAGAR
jgi:Flp pilus assembly protein TadG